MKLTFEEKKEIYRKHCAGISERELSMQYHIRLHNMALHQHLWVTEMMNEQ